MTLRDLMGNGAPEVEISGLAYSSRDVSPGTLFFCVPGFKVDGHDFAPDAVERGAAALVVQRPLGLGVPEVVVDDVRAAMGPVAARFGGDRACVMEVSSHALHMHRVAGIHFAVRVFTNLTQDHLDYHGTMEDYYQAKKMLFTRAGGPSIVNVDDP